MDEVQPATPNDSSKAPFRFRGLSGELRNKIYELLLVRDAPIRIGDGRAAEPALCKVDRTTRSEAQGVFYGDNTFIAITRFHWQWFIRLIGPQHVGMLRNILVAEIGYSLQDARQTLETLIQDAEGMPGDGYERGAIEWVNLNKLEYFVQLEDDGPVYRKLNVQGELEVE